MVRFVAGSCTDVGRSRANNQDQPLVAEHLFAVADGMGGHNGGEVASEVALTTLLETFTDFTVDGLVAAAEAANAAIFEQAAKDPDLRGMGTTLVAIAPVPGPTTTDTSPAPPAQLAWVNIGDSRLYVLRDDRLTQLSEDHSLVEEMVRSGRITHDEARTHPQRNILTRALGIDAEPQVDSDTIPVFDGDRFLLCSDGLFNEVAEGRIAEALGAAADPTAAAAELVRLANEGGGRDNITVVVVEVIDDGDSGAAGADAPATTEFAEAATGTDTTATTDDTDATDATDATDDTDATDATDDTDAVVHADPTTVHPAQIAGVTTHEDPDGFTTYTWTPTGEEPGGVGEEIESAAAIRRRRRQHDLEPQVSKPRVVTTRAVGFILVLFVMVGGIYSILRYRAEEGYTARLQDRYVVVDKGADILWFSKSSYDNKRHCLAPASAFLQARLITGIDLESAPGADNWLSTNTVDPADDGSCPALPNTTASPTTTEITPPTQSPPPSGPGPGSSSP